MHVRNASRWVLHPVTYSVAVNLVLLGGFAQLAAQPPTRETRIVVELLTRPVPQTAPVQRDTPQRRWATPTAQSLRKPPVSPDTRRPTPVEQSPVIPPVLREPTPREALTAVPAPSLPVPERATEVMPSTPVESQPIPPPTREEPRELPPPAPSPAPVMIAKLTPGGGGNEGTAPITPVLPAHGDGRGGVSGGHAGGSGDGGGTTGGQHGHGNGAPSSAPSTDGTGRPGDGSAGGKGAGTAGPGDGQQPGTGGGTDGGHGIGTGPGAGPGTGPGSGDTKPASPPKRRGTTSPASITRQSKPAYPAAARRDGVEGAVLLRVALDAKGNIDGIEVVTSSGDTRLDDAAQHAVKGWKFAPRREDGEAVASTLRVRVTFSLENE